MDTDDLQGVFHLLKQHIFIACSEDAIFIGFLYEDIGVVMVTKMISQ